MMSEQSLINRWAARIEGIPRLTRIILTLIITVFVVLLLWAVLAEVVGGGITSADPNANITLLVIVLGVVFYGAAWGALVGFENRQEKTWHAGPSAVYFLIVGLVSLILLVIIVALLVT
jgi:hypothetical protein